MLDDIGLPGSSSQNTEQSQQHTSPSDGHQRASQELWGGENEVSVSQGYPLLPRIGWLRQTSEANVRRITGICGCVALCVVGVRNQ